jgi:hypothetical protein
MPASWGHPYSRLLRLADATLLGRIAAAARSALAMVTGVAQLRGGGLATALAGIASAAGAAAVIIFCVFHRKLLLVGWIRRTLSCPMSPLCSPAPGHD